MENGNKRNVCSPISYAGIDVLYTKEILGSKTPQNLSITAWFNNCDHPGINATTECRTLLSVFSIFPFNTVQNLIPYAILNLKIVIYYYALTSVLKYAFKAKYALTSRSTSLLQFELKSFFHEVGGVFHQTTTTHYATVSLPIGFISIIKCNKLP